MNWTVFLKKLKTSSPDSCDIIHVEVNPKYESINGSEVGLPVEYDAYIFDFNGKYKDKYKTTVRIWADSRVTASITFEGNASFEYPISGEDEQFDSRFNLYGPEFIKKNPTLKAELKEIYEWTFCAYRYCMINS